MIRFVVMPMKKPAAKKSAAKKAKVAPKKRAAQRSNIIDSAEAGGSTKTASPGVQFYAAKKPGGTPYVPIMPAGKPLVTSTVNLAAPLMNQKPMQTWVGTTEAPTVAIKAPEGHQVLTAIAESTLLSGLVKTFAFVSVIGVMYIGGTWLATYIADRKPAETVATIHTPEIDTFAECAAAGFFVNEGNPRLCQTPDAQVFSEPEVDDEKLEAEDPIIFVISPEEGGTVSSPALIRARIRSYEDPIAITIRDADGTELGSKEFFVNVPSEGNYGEIYIQVEYTTPKELEGVIEIFEKISETERGHEVQVPVRFRK